MQIKIFFERPRSLSGGGSAGFSLLEILVAMGLAATLSLVIAQIMVSSNASLSSLNEKVATLETKNSLVGAFMGTNGTNALRNFASSAQGDLSLSGPVQLPPGRKCLVWNEAITEEVRSRVDLVAAGGPVVVRGSPIPLAPSLLAADLSLIQLADATGQCPPVASCAINGNGCSFILELLLHGRHTKPTIKLNLTCALKPVGESQSLSHQLLTCAAAGNGFGAPTPAPTSTPAIGDLNRDGTVGQEDVALLLLLWGPVPDFTNFSQADPTGSWKSNELAALKEMYRRANLSSTNGASEPTLEVGAHIDGGDLGVLLTLYGATGSKQCFVESPLTRLFERITNFAKDKNGNSAFCENKWGPADTPAIINADNSECDELKDNGESTDLSSEKQRICRIPDLDGRFPIYNQGNGVVSVERARAVLSTDRDLYEFLTAKWISWYSGLLNDDELCENDASPKIKDWTDKYLKNGTNCSYNPGGLNQVE